VTAADAPGVTRPPRNNETKASAFRRIGKPPATADDADVDAVGCRGRGRSRLGDNRWFGPSPTQTIDCGQRSRRDASSVARKTRPKFETLPPRDTNRRPSQTPFDWCACRGIVTEIGSHCFVR